MKFNVDEIMTVLEKDSVVNRRNLPPSIFHLVPRGLDEHGRMRNARALGAYKLDRIELGTEGSKERVVDAVRRAFSSELMRLLCQPTTGTSLAKSLCVRLQTCGLLCTCATGIAAQQLTGSITFGCLSARPAFPLAPPALAARATTRRTHCTGWQRAAPSRRGSWDRQGQAASTP